MNQRHNKNGIVIIKIIIATKNVALPNGSVSKFIPKNPVKNVSGMNSAVRMVNTFITSFVRFAVTERYVSSAPLIRSRKVSLMSARRTK